MSRIPCSVSLAAILCAALVPQALAHVTLEKTEAAVGASYKAVFRVGHGCDQSPTVRLEVLIPEGIIGVKPMAKPGWTINIERGPYETAHTYRHGAKFSEGVRKVIFSGGNLPDSLYDEFMLSTFVAAELSPGQTLYFPVIQQCEKGAHHWIGVPQDGRPPDTDPAPGVKLVPGTKGD